MQGRWPADSGGLFGGREGQSWAEKSLKNGRFLVEFQKLRKPQDAKGTYFPRNSPSALLEWGSGGRWFESSRPDIRKASRSNQLRLAFFSILGLVQIQPFSGNTTDPERS